MRESELNTALLEWYDINARTMPWRVAPADRAQGIAPDPYRIWLSEVMLQQTTVAAVRDYFIRFTTRWPTVSDLAGAQDADVMAQWAGLGYYARARNLLKCARVVVSNHNGHFPTDHETLLTLPGIGPYTAAAISAIAFDAPQTVVDGNVERVMARLFAIETPLPTAKPELTAQAARLTPMIRPGDYAQAVMDLGATICTPKSPACGICPWLEPCAARRAGIAATLPQKLPKPAKPTRFGIAYVGQRADGALLLETRPAKGLLGGMLGWPGAPWGDTAQKQPPIDAPWQTHPVQVRHTFTHFHLVLDIHIAQLPQTATPTVGHFIEKHQFRPADLPTVMRKVWNAVAATQNTP